MTSTSLKRLAALAAVGVSLSACAGLGTSVAEDDPETEVPNVSLGRTVMESLGAVPSRQLPINYTPRAPLVVPPNTQALVAPEAANQIAANDPNWPVDPDVVTRQRLREAAAREAGRDSGDPLPSGELLAERIPTQGLRRTDPNNDPGRVMRQSEFDRGWKSKGIDGTGVYNIDGTPRRRALVEPPVAYLQPAPGAPVAIPDETDPKTKGGILQRLKFW